MKYSLRVRPEVPDDVADAYRWYDSRSEGLGERFLRELNVTYSRIALAPEIYAKGEWCALGADAPVSLRRPLPDHGRGGGCPGGDAWRKGSGGLAESNVTPDRSILPR
jgi:hypothetical protein